MGESGKNVFEYRRIPADTGGVCYMYVPGGNGGMGMEEVMILRVITQAGELYFGGVTMVELNTSGGQMAIYPGHAPMIAAAAPGVLRIYEGSRKREAFLVSGLIQILPGKITILAKECEWPEED